MAVLDLMLASLLHGIWDVATIFKGDILIRGTEFFSDK